MNIIFMLGCLLFLTHVCANEQSTQKRLTKIITTAQYNATPITKANQRGQLKCQIVLRIASNRFSNRLHYIKWTESSNQQKYGWRI